MEEFAFKMTLKKGQTEMMSGKENSRQREQHKQRECSGHNNV